MRSRLQRAGLLLLGLSAAFEAVSVLASPAPRRAAQKNAPTVKPKAKAMSTPRPSSKPPSKASARSAKARPVATPPPAKPDRSLFQAAERAEKALRSSTRLRAKQAEWEKVATAYRTVVDRYPRSPYCDDALLKAGDLQNEMAGRFKSRRYAEQALESYALLVDEYPGSRLGEPALFSTYTMLAERNQRFLALEAAEKYLDAYPDGKRARVLTRVLSNSKTAPGRASADSGERTATKAGELVQVFGVRFWSGESSTRVVIDLDRKVEIKQDRLQSPPRLFVDLIGTRLHPNLVGKAFPVGNAFLKQIRVGVNRENVVRVVVDFQEASSHNVFFLADPERLVIDVRGEGRSDGEVAPEPKPLTSPSPAGLAPMPEIMESTQVTQPVPVLPEPTPAPVEEARPLPSPSVPEAGARPTPRGEVSPGPTPGSTPSPTPSPTLRPTAATPPPAATGSPSRNRDGTYSLARQLGLGARRICLDAGHGGHDTGAIGRRGTLEKDLTLAIVLRLEKMIRSELGADVVLTRDRDVFIPLEERTAIANASGADLFLSVHINSARNSTGRGLETYYLSFAKSAAAEELAARENAISQATMKDLNNLVKAIATNSKIDESRDFAGIIQRSNFEGLSADFQGLLDRGVHTAPFYVLIGANMPSILTEVGFISNPQEEAWLKSDDYQEKLAESLLGGVRSYLSQLNRNQATRLGGRSGVRVTGRARARP